MSHEDSEERGPKGRGGMKGGPGEQADRGTHGAFSNEPEVSIPPHEDEGATSVGDVRRDDDTRPFRRSEPPADAARKKSQPPGEKKTNHEE